MRDKIEEGQSGVPSQGEVLHITSNIAKEPFFGFLTSNIQNPGVVGNSVARRAAAFMTPSPPRPNL